MHFWQFCAFFGSCEVVCSHIECYVVVCSVVQVLQCLIVLYSVVRSCAGLCSDEQCCKVLWSVASSLAQYCEVHLASSAGADRLH